MFMHLLMHISTPPLNYDRTQNMQHHKTLQHNKYNAIVRIQMQTRTAAPECLDVLELFCWHCLLANLLGILGSCPLASYSCFESAAAGRSHTPNNMRTAIMDLNLDHVGHQLAMYCRLKSLLLTLSPLRAGKSENCTKI